MIIPQVHENLTRSGNARVPDNCPVCGGTAEIRQNIDVKYLYCTNMNCAAKQIKKFTHFVGRDAMNIEGLSEATIEKFVAAGLVREFADLYRLAEHRDRIVAMEGFGEKSFSNLIESVDKSRKTTAIRLLYGLGIPNIGLSNARLICRRFDHDWNRIENAVFEQLTEINGVGDVMADAFVRFFNDEENRKALSRVLEEIELEKPESARMNGCWRT